MLNREKSKCSDRNGGRFRKQQTIVKKNKFLNSILLKKQTIQNNNNQKHVNR